VDSTTLAGERQLTDVVCDALTNEIRTPTSPDDRSGTGRPHGDIAVGTYVDPKNLPMYVEQSVSRRISVRSHPIDTTGDAEPSDHRCGDDRPRRRCQGADRGFEYEVFEMEAGIGGLWWSQTYPGVAVDTASVYYSLSYEMTPDWSRIPRR